MLENYIDIQPIVTKLLLNSFDNNKLVQAYLFSSNDKSFLLEYALAFSKKIITPDYDEKICNMIQNNVYPELKIINPINNIIKKDQLLDLQQSFLVKPTIGRKLVYIINGADKLHVSSANTILKFLEEPNDDIIAILLTDNISKVIPTIKSRCQNIIFKNNIDIKNNNDILYEKYKIENTEEEKEIFYNKLDSCVNFIKQIEKIKLKEFFYYKENVFDIFKTKEEFLILFDFMLYFYYDILNLKFSREIIYMKKYIDDLKEISDINELEIVENKLKLVEESKIKLESNMNLKLFMDEFIIKFSEV